MGQEISWWIFGALGSIAAFLLLWLLAVRKQTFDTPLLGLFSISILAIGVAVVRPTSIRLPDGTELKLRIIENEVLQIKEQLRQFALVDTQSNSTLYSSFDDGIFEFQTLTPVKESFPILRFRLKKRPRFVELRSTNGSTIRVSSPIAQDGWFNYEGHFSSISGDPESIDGIEKVIDRIVIEAYF